MYEFFVIIVLYRLSGLSMVVAGLVSYNESHLIYRLVCDHFVILLGVISNDTNFGSRFNRVLFDPVEGGLENPNAIGMHSETDRDGIKMHAE